MISIAITGNAGSGKSTLMRLLSQRHITTISADTINACLLRYCVFISGWLSRLLRTPLDLSSTEGKNALAAAIASNNDDKRMVENTLHPVILQNIQLHASLAVDACYCAIEVPLLYETGLENRFDRIILLASGKNVLESRIAQRNSPGNMTAQQILAMQDCGTQRYKTSHDIIINDTTLDNLEQSVCNLLSTSAFAR